MASGKKHLKIGLIGLGYWGKNILRNLHELGVLHTACDSSPEVIKEWEKAYPQARFSLSFDDILRDDEIQAVAISAPASTHYELTKAALNAGKDVFVEKPLALNCGHGRELVDLAKKKNRILMVGHILQYHPAIIKLKECIDSGTLGKIEYIYSNRLNIGKLRVEENILWSFAPHDISVILMLADAEPVRVNCFGGSYLNEGIFDVTVTALEFSNQTKAHIFVSWLHPFKEQKLIVVGSKAMAVFDDMTKEKLFIYPHKIEWRNGKIPIAHKAECYSIESNGDEPLKEELKHFIYCATERRRPRTDGEEALRVLRVLEEAEKAMVCGHGQINEAGDRKYFAHPSAHIDDGVEIGDGSQIWHFSHILRGSSLGKKCKIGQNVVIGPDAKIGSNVKIQNNVSVYEGVVLEDDVFCGPSCVFTNVINPRSAIPRMHEIKKTLVRKGASNGANATIVCGHDIGKYAFIGAGAVVTKDVPDHALVYGNPAKIQGWMCECGTKLSFKGSKAVCGNCKQKYAKSGNRTEKA